jgi:hypothetical protein
MVWGCGGYATNDLFSDSYRLTVTNPFALVSSSSYRTVSVFIRNCRPWLFIDLRRDKLISNNSIIVAFALMILVQHCAFRN